MRNADQSNIRMAFEAALKRTAEPWIPGVSKLVTEVVWDRLGRSGFDSENYATHKLLANDPTAVHRCIDTLDLGNAIQCKIEMLPAASRIRYEDIGLSFLPSASIGLNTSVFDPALALVASIPSLYETIGKYLRSVHILYALEANYDVSHSDPEVPFSIFVSIPYSGRERRVRLAESIIHECMHLHLSAIDDVLPLIEDQDARGYSPWRQVVRPLSGVLHGLYVFTVICMFFRILGRGDLLTIEERAHASKRETEIVQEAKQVAYLGTVKGFTNLGNNLVHFLFKCLNPQRG